MNPEHLPGDLHGCDRRVEPVDALLVVGLSATPREPRPTICLRQSSTVMLDACCFRHSIMVLKAFNFLRVG
jgi:hypothetical protein